MTKGDNDRLVLFHKMMNNINDLKYDLVNKSAKWYDPKIVCYVGHNEYVAMMQNIGPLYDSRNHTPGLDYIECGGAKFYRVMTEHHFQMVEVD